MRVVAALALTLIAGSAMAQQRAPQYNPQIPMANGQFRYMAPTYQGLNPEIADLTEMADVVGSAVNSRCSTDACRSATIDIEAGRLGRMAVNRAVTPNQNACIAANQAFGLELARLGGRITNKEESNGGPIPYQQANEVRGLLFTETYLVRRSLRDIISLGDAEQCNRLRDRGIAIMHSLIRTRLATY